MIIKYIACFVSFFLLSVYVGKGIERTASCNISLRTGDLLFLGTTSGELSKAIDKATQTANKTHFDHVGLVELSNDTIWVLHAAPKKGIRREPISIFLSPGKEPVSTTVYRLKDNLLNAIPEAIQKAHSLIGLTYNYTYRIKDPGYYCSEYIYDIFAADSIFTLNPMTFKDPGTGVFLPGWVDYYQKLGISVPEGEPGCNPNGLAASPKLQLIGELKFKIDH